MFRDSKVHIRKQGIANKNINVRLEKGETSFIVSNSNLKKLKWLQLTKKIRLEKEQD